jgi:putative phosphoesterase
LLRGPFRDVAAILHAGDITEMAVLDAFAGKEVIAVCGNMDSQTVRDRLPAKRIWKTEKFRIGLIHGWGEKQDVAERIRGEFEKVDCIVYGHTHVAASRWRDGIYYFNPGSFAGGMGGGKSVGVLELGETISGAIYNL